MLILLCVTNSKWVSTSDMGQACHCVTVGPLVRQVCQWDTIVTHGTSMSLCHCGSTSETGMSMGHYSDTWDKPVTVGVPW